MPKRKANKDSNGKDSMCRSPLDQLCDIAELIREEINDEDNPKPKHLEAMKNCPFWNFYRPFHEGRIDKKEMQKRHKGVEDILNTFNPKKNVFQLGGGKEFKSTAEQLAVIFGLQRIRAGAEDCTFNPLRQPNEGQKNLSPQETEFLKTYLKGRTQMKKRAILDSLYATAVDVTKSDDFVKLLVLYFCISIFFPNQTGWTLPNKFLKFIFAMDQVSWPDLIHSYLLQALKEVKKPCSSVRGCIVYILFWFAEVTHFISKNEGELGKCKPRFVRWDSRELAEKIGNEGLTSLKQDLTGSFIDPLDKDEQSLMTPIQIRQANSYRIGKKMVRGRQSDEDWELSPDRDVARSLVDLAHVYQSKKRKISTEVSRPCEGKGICKDSHGKDVHIGNLSSYSEAKTTEIESLEVGEIVEEPVDGSTSASDGDRESDEDWELSPDTDAARHLEDLAPVYPFKKRKASRDESHPCERKGICNAEPENLPLSEPTMPAIPILPTQESEARDNDTDLLHTTAKDLHGNDVHIGSFLSCSEAHTIGVESLEVGELVEKPVDATMNTSSSKCQTPDSILLITSTSVDASPSFKGSTSNSAEERVEGFEFADSLKIPEEYETLYKKIYDKYGHMATKKVIKFNDAMLLTCVTSLLKVISDMETVPGVELSEALLERWEGFIKDAEALGFNIKWLREGFNRLKNQWMSSFGMDREVKSHEQVLEAMKVKYVGLSRRKDELESELSEVKTQITKAEATISSVEEAIQEMQTRKIKFQREPVFGIVVS